MKKLLTVIFTLILTFSACDGKPAATTADPSEPPESPSPTVTVPVTVTPAFFFTEENYPRVDGSTATIPLGEAVKAVLLGKPRDESGVDISGTNNAYMNFSGTNNAYMNLIGGYSDILFVYEMPDAAKAYMEERQVELEMTPIGRDALVFLLNVSNPVSDLTGEQIQDIYAGKITNWNEVGGPDSEILPFQRNETSGSQTLMSKLVMAGKPMMEAPMEYIIEGMENLAKSVAEYNGDKAAIGYNVYYYVSQMKLDPGTKLLSVDGAAPTNDTIASGKYPYINDFYAVIRKSEPEGSPARIMYEWITGEQGRQLIENEGYVTIG